MNTKIQDRFYGSAAAFFYPSAEDYLNDVKKKSPSGNFSLLIQLQSADRSPDGDLSYQWRTDFSAPAAAIMFLFAIHPTAYCFLRLKQWAYLIWLKLTSAYLAGS